MSICELKQRYEKDDDSPLKQSVKNIDHYCFELNLSSDFLTEIREEMKEADNELNIPINEREQIGNNH